MLKECGSWIFNTKLDERKMKFHKMGVKNYKIGCTVCDDIGSRISNTAEDRRRNEKDAAVKSLCDVTKLRESDTIGVQRQIEIVSEYLRRFPQRFVEIFG
jgi:hypothetical protein